MSAGIETLRIYNPIKNRFVKVKPFGAAAKKLYKIYIDDLDTPPENVLPPGLNYNPETGYFTKTKEKKKEIKQYRVVNKWRYSPNFLGNTDGQILSKLKNIFRKFTGQTIQVITYLGGEIFHQGIIDVPTTFSAWWKEGSIFTSFFLVHSPETNIFSEESNTDLRFMEDWDDAKKSDWFLDNDKSKLKRLPLTLQGTLIIDTLTNLDAEKYKQSYLDGINHCVFDPMKSWAIQCEEDSKSKTAQKRYSTMIKKLDKYIIQYANGLPELDIQDVMDKLQLNIEIDLPSPENKKNLKLLSVKSNKKGIRTFKFLNTRFNHLDLNDIKTLDEYKQVSHKFLIDKQKELIDKKEFFIYKENTEGISQLNTLRKIYRVESEYNDIVRDFEKDNNLHNYKINHIKNRGLSEFCKNAVLSNCTIDFEEDLMQKNPDEYNHIDMTRAYTKSQDNSYYKGFLGKITDFRKTDKIMGLGLYLIRNIRYKDDNNVLKKICCFHNNNIYPSTELQYYKDNGIDFDIVCGCWGNRMDIDFGKGKEDNTGMYKKINKVRVYCKWFGCLTIISTTNKYKIGCSDPKYYKNMKAYNNGSIANIYFKRATERDDECGIIEYKKRAVYHQSHIAAFVTSYQRISLLQQLLKFKDFNQVSRVCVDGIYFKGEVELMKNFTYKNDKNFNNEAGDEYVCDNSWGIIHSMYSFMSEHYYSLGKNRENNRIEFHKGPGGGGKTHYNLTDKGFIDICFISPSWKLSRNKQIEYGCDSTCFYHALTEDPEIYQEINKKYSVLVIDEVSMLKNFSKNKIIERFQNQKIIFCGDVGFQLDPVWEDGEEKILFEPEYLEYYYIDNGKEISKMILSTNQINTLYENSVNCIDNPMKKRIVKIKTIEHNNLYRCKCDTLKQNLLMIRELIDKCNKKNIQNNSCFIKSILKNLNITDRHTIDYKIDDFIITKTHIKKDEFTEKYKDLKKYMILSKSRDFSNGEIVIGDKPKGVNSEIRHAFTIHSIQGETVENKLFIDIRNMTNLKMLYTAISRAQKWKQIIFIE